ncbi:MAG: hypothetical protein PHW77_00415 [Eubacteriales bacterium]|nr:hypothetical protein [Eubacteriales bacterium]
MKRTVCILLASAFTALSLVSCMETGQANKAEDVSAVQSAADTLNKLTSAENEFKTCAGEPVGSDNGTTEDDGLFQPGMPEEESPIESECSDESSASFENPDNSYISYPSQRIRTGYYEQGTRIIVISSADELEAFFNDTDIGGNIKLYEVAGKYDAEYFKTNILIMVLIKENSGSIQHQVIGIDETGHILINRVIPETGTCDMAGWNILIEVPNSHPAISAGIGFTLMFQNEVEFFGIHR